MKHGKILFPLLVFAALAGFLFYQTAHDARPAQAAGALLGAAIGSCGPGSTTGNVTLNWAPFAGQAQWLDLSTEESFASFTGYGPMSNDQTSRMIEKLPGNTVHFWRINTLRPDGWTTSETGAFVPCGAPRLLWGPLSCEGRFRAQVHFRWAPSAAGTVAQYLDLGHDPAFVPGSFVGRQQGLETMSYLWTSLQANVLTYFRVNALDANGVWHTSDTGGFIAECGPPVRPGIISSGDRLLVKRVGIDAPVNIRDVDSSGELADPAGPLDVVRYNFPLNEGFGGYPGQGGSTLIAGHLDFRNYGLAVFAPLRNMVEGDIIDYVREDGVVVSYQVNWVADVAPTYGFGELARTTSVDALVLITCIGQFDWSIEQYSHRRVVYATKVNAVPQ